MYLKILSVKQWICFRLIVLTQLHYRAWHASCFTHALSDIHILTRMWRLTCQNRIKHQMECNYDLIRTRRDRVYDNCKCTYLLQVIGNRNNENDSKNSVICHENCVIFLLYVTMSNLPNNCWLNYFPKLSNAHGWIVTLWYRNTRSKVRRPNNPWILVERW